MIQPIYADQSVSTGEFKRDPAKVVSEAGGRPVAVLENNKPSFYVVPAELFEQLAELLEDLQSAELVRSREDDGRFVDVSLDEL